MKIAFPTPAGQNPLWPEFTASTAFAGYEWARPLMPAAKFPRTVERVDGLIALKDRFDVFVFDAYGVLNVGAEPIPGALACVDALRAAGKTCLVATNAASLEADAAFAKFAKLGFNFPRTHIASSRQAAEEAVTPMADGKCVAVLGLDAGEAGALPFPAVYPGDNATLYEEADIFLFLSNLRWSAHRQAMLEQSLEKKNRPVIIANPDIIAPQERGMSTEPGYFGYRLAGLGLGTVQFHGKPFPSIYDLVRRNHPAAKNAARVCMIGDTLHTDVLGGASQGWGTVLVTGYGLFKGERVERYINASGIVPDFIVQGI